MAAMHNIAGQGKPVIQAEAVEAARKVAFERYGTKPDAAYLRTILEAAAPYMLNNEGEK